MHYNFDLCYLMQENTSLKTLYLVFVAAMVAFVKETVSEEVTGKCTNFQTVPGCGLKCSVSHITSMLQAATNSLNIANYNNQLK